MKPVILLIPGMLNDASVWDDVLPYLPDSWTVRIANLQTQESIAEMAHDAWQLLEDIPANVPAMVTGFSLGGYVAIEMMAHLQRPLLAVALLSTSPLPESEESRAVREKTMLAMQANFPKVVEGIVKFGTHEASESVQERLRQMLLSVGCETALRQTRAIMGRADHREALSRLSLPVALLCGEHDRVTPPQLTQQLAQCIAHAQTCIIPQSGHMLPVQQAPAVAKVLASLLH
jgi:pimeloyl-ACP methyl ester carboxylesterase